MISSYGSPIYQPTEVRKGIYHRKRTPWAHQRPQPELDFSIQESTNSPHLSDKHSWRGLASNKCPAFRDKLTSRIDRKCGRNHVSNCSNCRLVNFTVTHTRGAIQTGLSRRSTAHDYRGELKCLAPSTPMSGHPQAIIDPNFRLIKGFLNDQPLGLPEVYTIGKKRRSIRLGQNFPSLTRDSIDTETTKLAHFLSKANEIERKKCCNKGSTADLYRNYVSNKFESAIEISPEELRVDSVPLPTKGVAVRSRRMICQKADLNWAAPNRQRRHYSQRPIEPVSSTTQLVKIIQINPPGWKMIWQESDILETNHRISQVAFGARRKSRGDPAWLEYGDLIGFALVDSVAKP